MKNVVFERFETVQDFLKKINSRENNDIMRRKKSSKDNGRNFTGTKSYEEAEKLLINGWDEPLSKIKKSIETVDAYSKGNKQRPRNAVVGYIPNVPNALLNLPESMITIKRIPQKVRAITIYYASTANCMTETREFIDAGVKILSAINHLESSGIRVSLYALCFCAESGDDYAFCPVKIKDYRDKLDLKKICFPMVNASWLRRFGFKWIETCRGIKDDNWSCGYGRSVYDDTKEKFEKDLRTSKILKDTDYFFTLSDLTNLDVEQIISKIKK